MDYGTDVMRTEFNKIHDPNTLDNVLQSHKNMLSNLPSRVLPKSMFDTLYPSVNTFGKSTEFDITLLSVLFRNICSLNPPVVDQTGRRSWDEDPLQSDQSLEADLVRLKLFRNRIYAHAKGISMSYTEFCDTWEEISQVLVRRGGSVIQKKVDKLRKLHFTQLEETYSKELLDWYINDQELKKSIDDCRNEVKNIGDAVGTVSNKLTDAVDEIESIGNAVMTVDNRLTDIGDAVGTVSNKLTDAVDEVQSIGNAVMTVDNRLTDIGDAVGAVSNKLTDVEHAVTDKTDHEVQKIMSAIQEIDSKIDSEVICAIRKIHSKIDDTINNGVGKLRREGKGGKFAINHYIQP